MRNVAERRLDSGADSSVRPHFMGAIILQAQDSSTAEVDKRLVIDGQQRLTTLQLFIKAAEVSFQNQNDGERAARLRSLTRNEESRWGGDSYNETKIRQSNILDQAAFQRVIRGIDSVGQNNISVIYGCYRYYLGEAIAAWLNAKPEERNERADALEEALARHLQVAVIDLDKDEKPHVIFETLNTRGEPLRQSDLIKNTVMYEAGVIDDAKKAEDLWGMFGDEWWRGDTKEQRLNRIQIDRFLNYWMIMRARTFLASDRTAAEFRNYIDPQRIDGKPSSIEDIASDIRKAGAIYRDMEQTKYPGIETFLTRIKAVDAGVVMPLLLWLYTAEVTQERRARVIKVLESYLVRRMLCGLSVQGMSHLFIRLIERLNNAEPEKADDIVLDYLKNQTVAQQIWPNDRILTEELTNKAMHGNVGRQKMVMEAIELHLRSNLTENLGDTANLTLEHVMPQRWSEQHWPLPTDTDEAGEERTWAVNAIGNLTLVTGKLNNHLSNGPWVEKRETLSLHSGLFLNKTLLAQASDAWDEGRIRDRSGRMAEMVIQIWPHADGI